MQRAPRGEPWRREGHSKPGEDAPGRCFFLRWAPAGPRQDLTLWAVKGPRGIGEERGPGSRDHTVKVLWVMPAFHFIPRGSGGEGSPVAQAGERWPVWRPKAGRRGEGCGGQLTPASRPRARSVPSTLVPTPWHRWLRAPSPANSAQTEGKVVPSLCLHHVLPCDLR